MAFGFKYSVTLIITHESLSADVITTRLSTITPSKTVTVGEIRTFTSGQQRPAYLTNWEAPLHSNDQLDSEVIGLSEFLRSSLLNLEIYKKEFHEFNKGGNARLEIVWRSDSIHSAGILEPDVLERIGSIGLSLDIEYYHSRSKE